MTFRDYIEAISITEFYDGSHSKLVADLFKEAGAVMDVVIGTASCWIKPKRSKRNCKIREYFPNDRMNELGFINFLSSRTNTEWRKIQDVFRSMSDEDCIVDLNTNSATVFYWSLLNQFQKIHKLPLTIDPMEEMVNGFEQVTQEYHLLEWTTPLDEESSAIAKEFIKNININILA